MGKNKLKWATRVFILSIFLSIVFGMISQSIFPVLPAFLSVFVIFFFVFVSCIFDMIGIAFASYDKKLLEKHKSEKEFEMAEILCNNTDKISSFCGDVVGDICGILSGAGGVSLVLNLNIQNPNIMFLTTCFVSSFIAGLTIFGKAVMKTYAVESSEKIVLKTSKILQSPVFCLLRKKKNKKR